jgi:HlyD family secretion protein
LPLPGFGGPRGGGRGGRARPSGSAAPAGSGGPERIPAGSDALYVLRDGQPRRMRVEAGATDGIKTEVKGRRLSEGMEVIVDVASGDEK